MSKFHGKKPTVSPVPATEKTGEQPGLGGHGPKVKDLWTFRLLWLPSEQCCTRHAADVCVTDFRHDQVLEVFRNRFYNFVPLTIDFFYMFIEHHASIIHTIETYMIKK